MTEIWKPVPKYVQYGKQLNIWTGESQAEFGKTSIQVRAAGEINYATLPDNIALCQRVEGPPIRFLVSYTYLTEGKNREFATDLVEGDTDKEPAQVALEHIRSMISTEGVLLGVWPAGSLEYKNFGLGDWR